jgi:membrane associated rhomboid family serine protease
MTGPDEENTLKRYYRRMGQAGSIRETNKVYYGFWTAFWRQINSRHAPVTAVLSAMVLVFFFAQVLVDSLFRDSILISLIGTILKPGYLKGVTAWLYINFPFVAWLSSPFLHKGIFHLLSNIALLAIFGKYVEPQIKTRYFILWFIVVTLVTKPIHAWISLQMTTKPNVAVYGISNFVFSLGFFSAIRLYCSNYKNEFEYAVWVIGILAVLTVGFNAMFAAWQGSISPVNPGHLVGGIFGMVIFAIVSSQGI